MFNLTFLQNSLFIFWAIRTIKGLLFWVYLWQLKSYHWGRFLAHFQTHQGKKLLTNYLLGAKIVLLAGFFWFPEMIWALTIIYLGESIFFIKQLAQKQIKKPVLTQKAILLLGILAIATGLFSYYFHQNGLLLLVFDVALPLTASLIVLLVEPIFILMRKRIIKMAHQKISKHKKLIVIGITGSYGKTSTKEFLSTILSSQFKVLATPEHKNSEMGIAQTILKDLTFKHEVFIVEMGAYNQGGITLLCDMVMPTIGIVTGVNAQHLATFGSFEKLLSAEGGRELARALGEKGLLVVNGDNTHCVDLYKEHQGKKKIYTTKNPALSADIKTEDITVSENGLSFIVSTSDGHLQFCQARVLGKQQVQNLLGAILVARELGLSLEKISQAIKIIRPSQGGMTVSRGIYNISIIDSSYSANPDGVVADLEYLKVYPGKKVIVMPCLIELGKQAPQIHQNLGKSIAGVCDLAVITTKDFFADIKKGAIEAGMKPEAILLCDKPEEAFTEITTFCKENDAVLLEGRINQSLISKLKDVQ